MDDRTKQELRELEDVGFLESTANTPLNEEERIIAAFLSLCRPSLPLDEYEDVLSACGILTQNRQFLHSMSVERCLASLEKGNTQ